MSAAGSQNRVRNESGSEGYALLFVLFLMALVIIGASTAVLDSLTEGRRAREADMIWRGKQYERAIGRYYKKFGRFPSNVDQLVKVQNGELRFLREAYKNPVNTKDGTWRFIYVTPSGQLIGSVQYVSLQQMALIDQQRRMGLNVGPSGATAGTETSDNSTNDANAPSGTAIGGTNSSGTNSTNGAFGQNPGASQMPQQFAGQNLQAMQQSGSPSLFGQQAPQGMNSTGGIGVQESSGSTDSNGQVIGGFIIGVAGIEDKPSNKVYKGGTTYKRWEFIYNPLEQVQTFGGAAAPQLQQSGQPQTPNQPQQPQMPQQPQQQ
ncbi:MAG TPA: hypothetical protein VKB26_13860 [Candidatus Acidoferrales bacterium]|nr:hypothetical protein [Candidatus Acidoferrales bacterium]